MTKENDKKSVIDSGTFNIILIVLTTILISWMFSAGILTKEGLTSTIGGSLVKVVTFLITALGLEFFERGIGTNVRDEIYEQNNIAAAIIQAGWKIAIALVISGGII